MDNIWTDDDKYPCEYLDKRLARVIEHFAEQIDTTTEMTGPIVISTICAAVQAQVDVRAPFGVSMPTSENTLIIAGPTFRKSASRQRAMKGLLEDDEIEDDQHQRLPFILENATEAGILQTLIGTKTVMFAHDDASKFMLGLEIPAACKRFDGSVIRHTTRQDKDIVLSGRRTSMCLFIQDQGLTKVMNKKGDDLINLGFLGRNLISFAGDHAQGEAKYTPSTRFKITAEEEWFHARVREVKAQDSTFNAHKGAGRKLLEPSAEGNDLWYGFTRYLDRTSETWDDVQTFSRRAPEHVLRIAGALQWFLSPQLVVDAWAIDMAAAIVSWHLREVKRQFAVPPRDIQMAQYANQLDDFLQKRTELDKVEWDLNELKRYAPKSLRDPDILNMALALLTLQGKIYRQKLNKIIVIKRTNSNRRF